MKRALLRACSVIAGSLGGTTFFGWGHRRLKDNFLILYYHKVVPDAWVGSPGKCEGMTGEVVPVSDFENQVKYIIKNYKLVSLAELFDTMNSSGSGRQGNYAAITFDDAYRGVYNNAFPVLKKYGVNATVFCPGDVMDQSGNFNPVWVDKVFYLLDNAECENFALSIVPNVFTLDTVENKEKTMFQILTLFRERNRKERDYLLNELAEQLSVSIEKEGFKKKYLSISQIQEMQNSGVSFEPHTMSHPDLNQIVEHEVIDEIKESRNLVEQITGKKCRFFSFPFGEEYAFNSTTIDILKSLGFDGAVTTIDGVNYSGAEPFTLKRVLPPGKNHNLFLFRATGLSGILKRLFGYLFE